MNLLIIIPAFNEAENIERVVFELQEKNIPYDYVIVNDGSKDDTRKICEKNRFNYIDLHVNVGLGEAIRAGMKYANFHSYDYAIQIDGDGQHNPEYIDKLVSEMQSSGVDIVIGSRFVDKEKPRSLRMFGSNLISTSIKLTTGKKIFDVTSGMRLFNKKMIKKFAYSFHYSPEPETLAYLLKCGVNMKEVQVEMRDRIAGVSAYNHASISAKYMANVLFSILIFQAVRKKEDLS
ncbi:MAG: glycosyltransferase family 2 protein [Coriobacteriales bacterium]|nr:glycosyltransferase family 2 protein [Coriobacteriales bacterium]